MKKDSTDAPATDTLPAADTTAPATDAAATEESKPDEVKPDIAGCVPGRNVYFYPSEKSGWENGPIPGIISQVFDKTTGEASITLFPSHEQNPGFQTGYASHVLFSEDQSAGTWGWMVKG